MRLAIIVRRGPNTQLNTHAQLGITLHLLTTMKYLNVQNVLQASIVRRLGLWSRLAIAQKGTTAQLEVFQSFSYLAPLGPT